MPVCRVAHAIYSHAIGGSERCAMEICASLDRSRWDPLMIFLHANHGPLGSMLDERRIPHVDMHRSRFTRLLWPWFPAMTLKRLRIDVLHVHHLAFLRALLPAARLAGIRNIVCTEHSDFDYQTRPRLLGLVRHLPASIPAFTVVSRELQQYFSSACGIPPEKIHLIYNGVDTRSFSPGPRSPAMEKLLGDSSGARVVVAVGRLTEAKDYPTLFEALQILLHNGQNLRCIIVGNGELHQSLSSIITGRNLSSAVLLTGTRTDVDQLLPGADCYVLSSRHEGLPISLLEAMACGLPAVATRVGGVAEIIENDINGLIVPPENPEALAQAITHVLTDTCLASRLGMAARAAVEQHYSWSCITRSYETIYEELFEEAGVLPADSITIPVKGASYEIPYSAVST